jgi:aspartyl-tRNA(Asn)/glutamyl-tRNA(Gln) amidotransferase subunit A
VPDWDHVLTRSPGFQPRSLLGLFSWTAFINYLGLPAIAFPIGQDDQGRPVCVQAIARPHAEALLLAFAYEAERERFGMNGFIERPPALRP